MTQVTDAPAKCLTSAPGFLSAAAAVDLCTLAESPYPARCAAALGAGFDEASVLRLCRGATSSAPGEPSHTRSHHAEPHSRLLCRITPQARVLCASPSCTGGTRATGHAHWTRRCCPSVRTWTWCRPTWNSSEHARPVRVPPRRARAAMLAFTSMRRCGCWHVACRRRDRARLPVQRRRVGVEQPRHRILGDGVGGRRAPAWGVGTGETAVQRQ